MRESAFRKKFITYRYNFLPDQTNFPLAQKSIKNLIIRQIMAEAAQKLMTRVSLIFIAEMIAEDYSGDKFQTAIVSFRAPTFFGNGMNPMEIERLVKQSFAHQTARLDEFMQSGSNWRFNRALAFDVEINAVNPIRGGCDTLQLKKWKNSSHLYNPHSKDNRCFLYCIAYFLLFGLVKNKAVATIANTDQNDMNLALNKKIKSFNIKGIQFPLAADDIKKFLRKNESLDLSINVLYRNTKDEVYPLEHQLGGGRNVLTLLLVTAKTGGHYMLITNPDLYLRKVYARTESRRIKYATSFFCLNCFSSFHSMAIRDKHVQICMLNKPRREETPPQGKNYVEFKHRYKQHWLDYIAYLDFECILPNTREKCKICSTLKCKCDNASSTRKINDQIPICYSFVVIDRNDRVIHEHSHIGQDAHLDFLNHLLEQEKIWIRDVLEEYRALKMSFQDTVNFNNSDDCYLCHIKFERDIVKCRDHDHFTGNYLGAACLKCNLQRRRQNRLKIFIHNASKYDMHFIIKALPVFHGRLEGISVLPYNGENFRTLTFNSFIILDSLSFLQAPLSTLAEDLRLSGHNYNILKQTYLVKEKGSFCRKKLEMVLNKSFFPYEFCTSFAKMEKTRRLPKLKHFYSLLSQKTITAEEHAFARTVWSTYGCKNLLDYCKLYCKIDVLLLAEIFQKFRREMKSFSNLDPAHYISLPAFGYDSMLLITGTCIGLPTDINMVHFFERAKRGGVSFINHRYLCVDGKTENKEQTQRSDTEGQKEEIIYIDKNNLYGHAQLQKLPLAKFKWLTEEETKEFDVYQDTEGEKGYYIECDLHYPSHLHEEHANFPLCPEILEVGFDNLSPYTQNAMLQNEGRKTYSDVKLMTTFHDKLNYVTHIKNLQLYLSLGMQLMKIHRVLEFEQDHILQPFIERTTRARQKATSKFQSDLYKKLVSMEPK